MRTILFTLFSFAFMLTNACANGNAPDAGAALIFGETQVATSKTDSVVIENPLATAYFHVDVLPSAHSQFTVSPLRLDIPPNDTGKIYVTYAPKNISEANERLILNYDTNWTPDTVTLQGTAMAAMLSFDPSEMRFGSGSANDTEQIMAHNTGNEDLNITELAIDDPFFTVATSPLVINPGDSSAIKVVLNEPSSIDRYADLIITSNDSFHPVDSVTVVDLTNDISVKEVAPQTFNLSCYPNPASNTTNFHFSIPAPSAVSLRIYNCFGTCVQTILDGSTQAGSADIAVPLTLPSGTYFYEFSLGSIVSIDKLEINR
ncbi:MAG TPA: T9SS type A sorting domain-containing protein [Candidatus Kapabacteria bacterium]|nr:T9SS type A sorting domain-containing protein [Candidatus Kapabacteria bacterium]